MKNKEFEIETNILLLEKALEGKELTSQQKQKIIDDLNTYKDELQLIIQEKTKGAIIRSNARWYKEGEKKSKGQLKTLTADKDILNKCKRLYTYLTNVRQLK